MHDITIEVDEVTGRARAVCSCGRYRSRPMHLGAAETAGRHHAEDTAGRSVVDRCGKRMFYSKEDAAQVLISARLARLEGNRRREERSVYYCTGCQAWHLSTREAAS